MTLVAWKSFVLFLRYAGILSAYGIALADVVHEAQEACSKIYCQGVLRKNVFNFVCHQLRSFTSVSRISRVSRMFPRVVQKFCIFYNLWESLFQIRSSI